MRPGEKLEEELVGNGEKTERSSVDKVLRIRSRVQPDVELLDRTLKEFRKADELSNPQWVIEQIQRFVADSRLIIPSDNVVMPRKNVATFSAGGHRLLVPGQKKH